MMIAAASGSRKRDNGRPVRELRREATGRYSAITAGLCISGELRPAMAVVSSSRRCFDAVRAAQQPAGEAIQRAGAIQARAEDHRRDHAR